MVGRLHTLVDDLHRAIDMPCRRLNRSL